MCDKAKPELLMVTTVDTFHHEYIVKGLDRGLDVMTEKPMVIDEKQCQAVLDAEKRNNRKIVVTFNYRYAPKHPKVKEDPAVRRDREGPVGRLRWYLDVIHGADYFRRWHRLEESAAAALGAQGQSPLRSRELVARRRSGRGHGATENFAVYGQNGQFRSTNCRACPHKKECRFYYDITTNATRMKLYVGAEDVDGYYRDGCVFREDVDIYDTMSAVVKYSNDVSMSYSLNAHMPFEGFRVAFNGELGRLEVRDYERQPWEVAEEDETEIYVTKSFGKRVRVPLPRVEGGHGGGDDRLRDLIFRKAQAPDHMKLPDSRAGAMSCLTGIAARNSIEQNRPDPNRRSGQTLTCAASFCSRSRPSSLLPAWQRRCAHAPRLRLCAAQTDTSCSQWKRPPRAVTWTVSFHGLPVIESSALGIIVDDVDLGRSATLGKVERYQVQEDYDWRGAKSKAVDRSNGMRVSVAHSSGVRYIVDVRVGNDSVAFRHSVPGSGRRVPDGGSTFTFPNGSIVWSHGLRDHYEAVYERRLVEDRRRRRLGALRRSR